MDLTTILIVCGSIVGGLIAVTLLQKVLVGMIFIKENELGVVIKKLSNKKLIDGALIALNGEAGYQADTLAPGLYFGYFSWKYEVLKRPLTEVHPGTIALVIAKDGKQIPGERILGKVIDCDNFQSAKKFLQNGGEKGRQLGILTAGFYRINTSLFEVVHADSMEGLHIVEIASDHVGIVTTLDGKPIPQGEIAGPLVAGHDNFQNPQAFIDAGGSRGLQEQLLLSGTWNINPWFASIQVVGVTEIGIGNVGVVISYVGKEHKDISGVDFKHGDLVDQGHKGVWDQPLYPGKHPLNIKTLKTEIVPTTNIALNWANNRSESHKLDEKLSSIKVRSKDGFSFVLDVTQIIHVGAKEASRVISRFGSMNNLVNQVLEPAIGNYFRNSAQNYTVIDFLVTRKERQQEALKYIKEALVQYNVEAVETYIGDLVPPEELMKTLTDRKLAEEQKSTYKVQEEAQVQMQSLEKERAIALIQSALVQKEQEVRMSEFKAQSQIREAEGAAKSVEIRAKADSEAAKLKGDGEAAATRAVGLAKAAAYEASVKAMGEETFRNIETVKAISEGKIKVTPDTLINGGGGDSGSLMLQTILARMVAPGHQQPPSAQPTDSKNTTANNKLT